MYPRGSVGREIGVQGSVINFLFTGAPYGKMPKWCTVNVFSTSVFKYCHLSPVCAYLIVVSHREGNNQMRYVVRVEIELIKTTKSTLVNDGSSLLTEMKVGRIIHNISKKGYCLTYDC